MPKYNILKLRADKIIDFGFDSEREINDYTVFYQVNLDNEAIYGAVVEEQLLMENCALFDQFQIELGKEESEESNQEWLLTEIVIVDFAYIYKKNTGIPEDYVKNLITNGFIMRYEDKDVHMLPFDKSGNMSRKCRLSFINAEHLEKMNERLNLGIDFSNIPVNLSKYYNYRGLYLSTAKRIKNELLNITQDTLIIVDDQMNKAYANYRKSVHIETGIQDKEDNSKISFVEQKVKRENIDIPFDGQGLISPFYADLINEAFEGQTINSFQIRLPFTKGMLHRVDFHAFLYEFDSAYKEDRYFIKDAFGIKRDLKLANIVLTKSMFKGFEWIKKHCEKENILDPMEYYCDALKRYGHELYISSTDIPYGSSKVTHISYQLLNTLQLSDDQFKSLINKQLTYIQNPLEYIKMAQVYSVDDNEENSKKYEIPNWQKALLLNPHFGKLIYVKNQLQNIQASLMTKLALGKLVVKGQTRYMARDLPSMLVNLIQNEEIKKTLMDYKIFYYRFYLPQGSEGGNEMGLDYYTHCGFFRSPHLSRNEQGLLAPMVKYECGGKGFNDICESIDKYFGHLTGVVMFGNESLEPMALGGADFDGDLVSVIMDDDVNSAIRKGVYIENSKNPLDIKRRDDMPYIKIPSIKASEEKVPKTIPYLQIKNTFTNKIGLISDAAIAIGQFEYGNKESTCSDMKCLHCTILTGLEIDAAKNGVHPDLSFLTKDAGLKECGFLKFKKEFENLKSNKKYHFNQLELNKKDEEYTLSLNGTEETIKYIEEDGTYINKLPIIFMENLNPELNIPDGKKKKYFNFPRVIVNEKIETVFKEQCEIILESYKYYSDLFTFIQKETRGVDYRESNYRELNFKKLLDKQYDAEYVERIVTKYLPYLYKKIAGKINNYFEYKQIEKKINQKKWHLMNEEKKKKFLCEILEIESLEDPAWSIVLQPYNHNYKVLWYIIQEIGSGLNPDYCSIRKIFDNRQSKQYQLYPYVSEQADVLFKKYLENKESGTLTRLYGICLTCLKDVVDVFQLPESKKMEILFKLTKNGSRKARFFWECFEWDELEPYIVKEEHYAG